MKPFSTRGLPRTQRLLMNAIYRGVVVSRRCYWNFGPPMKPYYYRSDTGERCTAAAKALELKWWVEAYGCRHFGYSLRARKCPYVDRRGGSR